MGDMINGFTGFAQKKDKGKIGYEEADPKDMPREHRRSLNLDQVNKIPETDRRWSWVEVDLGAIKYNTSKLKGSVGRCQLMAIVKADAYGHGAIECAKAMLGAGASYLGVATVDEGIALRNANITAPILVLSQPPETAIPLLLAYKLEPSICNPEYAIAYGEMAYSCGLRAPYHIAVNTGMNRIGVNFDEASLVLQQISFHRSLQLKGVFTHFATADSSNNLEFERQLRRFEACITDIRQAGINPGLVHAANSAASIRYPQSWFDMVRCGIVLYGLHPCKETFTKVGLKLAMSVHARITDTHIVSIGGGVSYGLKYRSTGNSRVCTLPIGYADGYPRVLSQKASVLYKGHRLQQVGTICMDQCMIEVPLRARPGREYLDPQVGEEVVLVGRQMDSEITLDELAEHAGTINYELACSFGMRLPRIYV